MEKNRKPAYGLYEAAKDCMKVEWARDESKKDKEPSTLEAIYWLKNPLNTIRATGRLASHKHPNPPEDHTV